MTLGWIVLLVGLSAAMAVAFRSWQHRIDMTELGTVSEQWLAEQRANDRHSSAR